LRRRVSSGINSDFRALSGVSRKRAWGLTSLAMLALSVTLIHRQALAALAATVTGVLGISDVQYGWLSSGFAGAYLLGSMPAARFIQGIGPRIGLALTVAASSIALGLHGVVASFWGLMALRIVLGLAVAPSFPCATQTIHRVLPFKDRARGIGLLYLGNSLGSALCPPLAVLLASTLGWRSAFFAVALVGAIWVPLWVVTSFTGGARLTLDDPLRSLPINPLPRIEFPRRRPPSGLLWLVQHPGVFRGSFVVAAAAPITTILLIWGTKYLVRDHGLPQKLVGRYLWAPALCFGTGSVLFGELRARTARSRSRTRPPRLLMSVAALMALLIGCMPMARSYGPAVCIAIASVAMAGAGGLYTLATSDMLVNAPRGTVPATTGLTTLTQSLVYILVSPLIGKLVEHFGNYDWPLLAAGMWVAPGCAFWLVHATVAARAAQAQELAQRSAVGAGG
jgi:ACS family hexuronate transporter-like MFS transporter